MNLIPIEVVEEIRRLVAKPSLRTAKERLYSLRWIDGIGASDEEVEQDIDYFCLHGEFDPKKYKVTTWRDLGVY